MAQAWADVASSKAFQELPANEQMAAKQQYFTQVVSAKPEFQALPDEEKQTASSQFMSGPVDPRSKSFESQMTKGMYDTVPFGKDLVKTLDPGDVKSLENTPPAQGFSGIAGRFVGGGLGMAPSYVAGEGIVGPAAGAITKMAAGSVGAGVNAGGEASSEGATPEKSLETGAEAAGATFAGGKLLEGAGNLIGKIPVGGTNIGNVVSKVQIKNPTTAEGWHDMAQQVRDLSGQNLDDTINQTINEGINKGIRPSVSGKQTPQKLAQFDTNATSAIKDLVTNQDKVKIQDDNDQEISLNKGGVRGLLQGINQRMGGLVKEWQALASQADDSGVKISAQPYISKLNDLMGFEGTDKNGEPIYSKEGQIFQTEHSADFSKINSIRDGLQLRGEFTPNDLLDKIQEWNADLAPKYKGGFQYGATRAINVVRDLTSDMRGDLDDAITSSTGTQFQPLRTLWGSYKSLLKDVAHRAIVAGRANPKGIWNLLDSAGNAEMFSGATTTLSGAPHVGIPMMIKGGALKIGKAAIEKANNPNEIINNMITKVGGLMDHKASLEAAAQKAGIPVLDNTSKSPLGFNWGDSALAGRVKGGSDNHSEPLNITKNLEGTDMTAAGEASAHPGVTTQPVDTTAGFGGPELNQEAEGGPAKEYIGPSPTGDLHSLQSARIEYEPQRKQIKDDLNYQSKIAGGALVGAGATAMGNKAQAAQLNDNDVLKTVLGEQEGGLSGQRAIASALRNRGTLHGAYGFKAIIEKDGNFYRKGSHGRQDRLIPKSSVLTAKQAVQDSKKYDYSHGAHNWFSDEDLKHPAVMRIIKGMTKVGRFGDNNFYRKA